MQLLERFLVRLDSGPWAAVSRAVLGFAMLPAFRRIAAGDDQVWISLALFVALLIGLRVIPALLRGVLPFSAETRSIWVQRRQIAKRYDSYQWQKLLWIGLGLSGFCSCERWPANRRAGDHGFLPDRRRGRPLALAAKQGRRRGRLTIL